MPEDAWWPAGEEAWELTDIGQSYGSQGNSSLRTVWIKPSSLGAKLAELFPERRKSAALDSTGFGCEGQDSVDKSGKDGGKTCHGQHRSSEVKGQHNYVGRIESGSYSHEDEDVHLLGFGHNSSVHVCQSRVPRPCRYMQRCRNPDSCRYCHHETHQDMRQKELWISFIRQRSTEWPEPQHLVFGITVARSRTAPHNSDIWYALTSQTCTKEVAPRYGCFESAYCDLTDDLVQASWRMLGFQKTRGRPTRSLIYQVDVRFKLYLSSLS